LGNVIKRIISDVEDVEEMLTTQIKNTVLLVDLVDPED
jgi:hypothetical protein